MLRVTMLALLSKYLYQVSFKENPQLPCTPFYKNNCYSSTSTRSHHRGSASWQIVECWNRRGQIWMRSFHSYQFWISFPKTHSLERLCGIQISIGILESTVMSRRRKIEISLACRITTRRRRIQLLRTRITSRRGGGGGSSY